MASTIWKGQLTFGLVSVPIKLFRAARAEKVHMHLLQRQTGARVRRVFVPAEDEAPVAQAPIPITPARAAARPAMPSEPEPAPIATSDLIRRFEYEEGKYIEFEPAELQDLAPKSSSEMAIVEFVKFSEVEPVYLENSYYVAPGHAGEKPYALLFEALRKTGQSAVAEFVMHRRDQIILLRAGKRGIIGHTLFHEDEVRHESEFAADAGLVVPKEMDLAIKLVDALAAPFEPAKFKDKYRERLRAAISAKTGEGAPPVIDIMQALKNSLSSIKKPAASEGRSVKSRGSRRLSG